MRRELVGGGSIGNLKWHDLLGYVKTNLSSRCALGYYIYKAIEIIHEKAFATYYSKDSYLVMKRLEEIKVHFRKRIIKNINLWKAKNVQVILVIFPGLIEENWPDWLIKQFTLVNWPDGSQYFEHSLCPLIQNTDREIITSISKEYKIRCYNFSDVVKGIAPQLKVGLFVDAIHMGPQLHNLIAEELFKGITNDLDLTLEENNELK